MMNRRAVLIRSAILILLLGSTIAPVLLPGIEQYVQIPQVRASPVGTEQVIFGGETADLHDTDTRYNSLVGETGSWNAVELARIHLVSTDGVFKYLRFKLTGSPGADKHYTFTLMVNGAPTALTFDISDAETSGSNMVNEITVTGGDRVSLQCDPDGTPTARKATWTIVFEGDTTKESIIMGGSSNVLNLAATEYAQVFSSWTGWSNVENDKRQVIPTAGTLKNFYVYMNIDPGDTGVDAYRLTLRKGGASQSLTVTITADDTTGSDLVNSFAVVAGDVLTMMCEPLDTPVATPWAVWGVTFVADINGESITMGGTSDDLDAAATEYNQLTPWDGLAWSADETIRYHLGQVCTLKKLHVLLSAAPGEGNDRDFAIRIAGTNVVTLQISDAETTGDSGVLSDTVANDEYLTIRTIPTDTPDAADAYWGFVCYIPVIVTVTETDTYTSTTCTETTTTSTSLSTSTGSDTTTSTDYTTTTDTISVTTITSLSTATTTSCETSCETCTTTCGTACLTITVTTTITTGDISTTTVVHTVIYDACVLDEFDDDALVAWYNNTHRHDSIVDILHEPALETPDGILTLVGTLDSGNLASVQTFDDVDSYNVSEVVGTPGFDIRFNFTGLTDAYTNVNCSIYVWYDGGAGHTVEVQTWNYTSGTWIVCGEIAEAADFGWFNFSRMGAGGDIVRGGILRGRIVHTSPGNINHDIFIDYIEARLDICPCGQVWSENMLEDLNATQIVYFRYNITITPYREAFSRVRFSQDNTTWVDSGGIAQWEEMTTGDNSILLTGLGWEGNFYYRVWMHKDVNGTSPTLDLVQVCYSTVPAGGGVSTILTVITLVLLGGVAITMVGMRKRKW